ncbi:MAG: FKBP-type peptidyl-prolyl cis-trans isomerase 1 [Parcubacteria group bacterium Athens0714_16]|nr:MAG: FKBP-type peptidyl-prolyl cis-trans isomerase 1 [Parcubacteria group bacterium Athens0714_16]
MDKKLNKNIAIVVGVVVVFVLFFLVNSFIDFNSIGLNDQTNENMATNNNLPTVEGLVATDVQVGDGLVAENGMLVTVNYEGTLDDGTIFDSSYKRNQPFQFVLGAGEVIQGWDLGVKGMKVGGTRELKISPTLGYGNQELGPIPANSNLNFKVELISVESLPAENTQ